MLACESYLLLVAHRTKMGAGSWPGFRESARALPGGKDEVSIMRTSGRYESSENSSNIGTAITFLLIGLGAGAFVGLLFAPKPGKQFRRDLQSGYEDAKDNFGDWADEAKDRVRDVSERVRDAAGRGVDFAEELRERAEPIRRAMKRS